MTIPAGAGSSSAGSQQQTHVPDDADDPGLPAATGNVAAGGAPSGDIQGGGPITDAVRDQAPEGVGSAQDAASTAGSGSVGQGGEAGPGVGDDDPSGI
jgi:hypothetical protein